MVRNGFGASEGWSCSTSPRPERERAGEQDGTAIYSRAVLGCTVNGWMEPKPGTTSIVVIGFTIITSDAPKVC